MLKEPLYPLEMIATFLPILCKNSAMVMTVGVLPAPPTTILPTQITGMFILFGLEIIYFT